MPRLTHLTLAALSLVAPALAACDYGTHLNPRSEGAVPISTFGYTALDGPLNWHGLNTTANALCATGKHQSPINIDASVSKIPGSSVEFVVDAYPFGAEFENLGTTVEVPVNGTLWADGKMYRLAQFHFHSTSEHRVEQEYFPMETHFVFSAPDKSTAVVSFLIELGLPDPLLTAVFASVGMISTPGSATTTGPLVFAPLEAHLKANPIFTYSGSLTTPPCSEGVTWYISSKPLQIDEATYHRVKDVIKFNSRYTQNALGETNLLQHAASLLK
ncbi:alpha carbonic anhydrase [Trichoderma longibrachiatum]|uniref:carbonic anhydrase n=1 Tax=Trichoderma longibrachiatum ATCC 18648 TaxID=983965 RepID=A0A2T4BS12_TRILO|nr:carbonic anhydrase [Trichoderma longibrachiatum ATCC 18648]